MKQQFKKSNLSRPTPTETDHYPSEKQDSTTKSGRKMKGVNWLHRRYQYRKARSPGGNTQSANGNVQADQVMPAHLQVHKFYEGKPKGPLIRYTVCEQIREDLNTTKS